jgi:PEGA domain
VLRSSYNHDHLNHTISRGVPQLTGHGFQYDPRTDSKESAPEIDLPLHIDTDRPEVAPPLQQDSIASSTSSSSRGIAAGMLVIGLLAGFVSGFLAGQRMAPAPPVQAASVPRAAQPPAPQPAAAQAPAPQPPTPVAESPVIDIPQNSPNRTAASEPALPQSTESAPSRPPAPAPSRASDSAPARPPQPASSRASEPPPSPRSEPAASRAQAPPASAQTARPVAPNKPAMLELVSRPLGATVFVDEIRVGVTPVTVNDVMPGTRLIRMELLGHQTWRTSVNVEAGAFMRIGASLE